MGKSLRITPYVLRFRPRIITYKNFLITTEPVSALLPLRQHGQTAMMNIVLFHYSPKQWG
jgi:hypothetical protein